MHGFIQMIQDAVTNLPLVMIGLLTGALDYWTAVRRGDRNHEWIDFAAHVATAGFFGWVLGVSAAEFGYSPNAVYVAAGLGGYLGRECLNLWRSLKGKGK